VIKEKQEVVVSVERIHRRKRNAPCIAESFALKQTNQMPVKRPQNEVNSEDVVIELSRMVI
jgi:hypothetical protein